MINKKQQPASKPVDNFVDSYVDKYEDNSVDSYVDKYEDNPEQNFEVEDSPHLSWVTTLVDQYLKPPFTPEPSKYDQLISEWFVQLGEALDAGDSCIHQPAVSTIQHPLLSNDLQAEHNPTPLVYMHDRLYFYRYWQLERRLASAVTLLSQKVEPIDLSSYAGLFSDARQAQALQSCENNAISLITGGPGTGKTYTLSRIVLALKQQRPQLRIVLAAPTGKAAQRMQQALSQAFLDPSLKAEFSQIDNLKNLQAQTIHRLLAIGQNQRPRRLKLAFDVIVIDEASMLDLTLAVQLFEAVAIGSRVILLGDINQLPSVDVGNILADFQQVELLQRGFVQLECSRRFAEDAKIASLANWILNQAKTKSAADFQPQLKQFFNDQHFFFPKRAMPSIDSSHSDTDQIEWVEWASLDKRPAQQFVIAFYRYSFLAYRAYLTAIQNYKKQPDLQTLATVVEAFDQFQVLAASRLGTLGVAQINLAISSQICQALNQEIELWYFGRVVMVQQNDYQLGLSNGDIGFCLYEPNSTHLSVYFPSQQRFVALIRLQHVQDAFAITIHKSQGSEFAHVAVVLASPTTQLLVNSLLYTAVTRAKKRVTIFATAAAFELTCRQQLKRKSGLVQHFNSAHCKQ